MWVIHFHHAGMKLPLRSLKRKVWADCVKWYHLSENDMSFVSCGMRGPSLVFQWDLEADLEIFRWIGRKG